MSSLDKYSGFGVNRKRISSKLIVAFVVVLVVIISTSSWFIFVRKSDKHPRSSTNQTQPETAVIVEERTIEGKYLFNGTIVLARAVEKSAGGDYGQPFSQLSTFAPEKYDAWLADLECPVTGNNVSYEQQVANLVFNCRTEWLPSFSKYFQFVNLANNHTSDMGADGFIETQKNLDAAGIQVVGNYDPANAKDACEVMALPVRVLNKDGKATKQDLPVAFCAFHYFFRKPNVGEMDIVKQFSSVMPTFGLMHVGVEYLPTAGTEQQGVAHSLIDLGSDFVIGNSPHWVQNSEVYKGKPIFYSTGNFIFDQIDYETQRGLSIDVSIQAAYDENLGKWLELGKQCKKRGDNCLELAKQQGLSKPKLKFTYEPVGSLGGNRRVTAKADATLQAAIEDRLGWATTKQQLGQ